MGNVCLSLFVTIIRLDFVDRFPVVSVKSLIEALVGRLTLELGLMGKCHIIIAVYHDRHVSDK